MIHDKDNYTPKTLFKVIKYNKSNNNTGYIICLCILFYNFQISHKKFAHILYKYNLTSDCISSIYLDLFLRFRPSL